MVNYVEYQDRPARMRTFESLQMELRGFGLSENFMKHLWHSLSGREAEAQLYLDAWTEEQEMLARVQEAHAPQIEELDGLESKADN